MSDLFAPAHAKSDPREKRCAGCGSGHAHCGVGNAWFCRACAPPDFWPGASRKDVLPAQGGRP